LAVVAAQRPAFHVLGNTVGSQFCEACLLDSAFTVEHCSVSMGKEAMIREMWWRPCKIGVGREQWKRGEGVAR
jgi:hypothetical protein